MRTADRDDRLPAQYEEFLRLMGRCAGKLLRGTDFFYPGTLALADDGRELLEENDAAHLLPPGAIVIGMHQGYELLAHGRRWPISSPRRSKRSGR